MERNRAFLVSAGVVALDRLTKIAVERNVSMWDSIAVVPGIANIVHTRNRGAAFGLLNDAPESVRLFLLTGVSLAIAAAIARTIWKETGARWPLALILGGAVGNLWDRIVRGNVTDFIQVFIGSYEWPSFNVADSAITIGAILLGLEILRPGKHVTQAH